MLGPLFLERGSNAVIMCQCLYDKRGCGKNVLLAIILYYVTSRQANDHPNDARGSPDPDSWPTNLQLRYHHFFLVAFRGKYRCCGKYG